LHRYIVFPAGNKTLEGRLGGTRWFPLPFHIEHTLDGIVRRYGDLVVGVDPGGEGRLPQHQQCGLIPEPHDELAGSVGFWAQNEDAASREGFGDAMRVGKMWI